jgi:hypothetical protein
VAPAPEPSPPRPGGAGGGGGGGFLIAPPITSDPPEHGPARRLLLPFFAPQEIARYTPITRDIARELLAVFRDEGRADAAADYAQHIPVRVISAMLGIPREDETRFTDWVVKILQVGPLDPEVSRAASREILHYFADQLEQRRHERRDDILSFLLDARIEGQPLSDKHLLGTCFLLLVAGIDTTWSAIGSSLWHLATHPDDVARLHAEPELMPIAVEEFLRAYSPVTMAREVSQPVELGGRALCPGDKVLLPFPAANRDHEVFPDPDDVRIDRVHNRHVAFGVGIHRCLGSNLARMELQVAIEEWLAAVPSFRLADEAVVTWTGGQVRGPRTVPVVFPA